MDGRLIGLTGPKRSGKSTVAQILVAKYAFKELSFAYPIKMALLAMFPEMNYAKLETFKEDLIPGLNVTWRHAMQTLGTEWGRECMHHDFWVQRLKAFINPTVNTVISDVRFENEATFIRNNGGVLIHINRDTKLYDQHVSEFGVSPESDDWVIENDGDLSDLVPKIHALLELTR